MKAHLLALMLLAGQSAMAAVCPSGAEVDSLDKCQFFKHYNAAPTKLDSRIAARIDARADQGVRSIALIVGIDTYKNLPAQKQQLEPAKVDVANLQQFFTVDQKFDEVIVLANEHATKANIEYFLGDYIPQAGVQSQSKARFVFAYSGHGIDDSNTSKAVFLLANAKSPTDLANSYRMNDLRDRLGTIATNYFHVLALINACYGGNVFAYQNGGGGSLNTTEQPGAYAMTASSDRNTSASLGGVGDGSVFFDRLIAGVRSGDADRGYLRIMDANGKLYQQGGIVRLGALNTYIDTEVEIINSKHSLSLDKTWIGPIQQGHARGGFFFISPVKLAQGSAEIKVPIGPRSSVPGRPDLKVFSAKEDYPIRGIDVTIHEGDIDWKRTRREHDMRFAYMRSSSWAGVDASFGKHWADTKSAGFDRGAAHIFDYCLTAQQQDALVGSIVPNDETSLPVAIVLEEARDNFNRREFKCYSKRSKAHIQAAILELGQRLQQRYGKVPLIRGNRSFLNQILDARFDRYMVWLAVYPTSKAPTTVDLGLKGSNPWTMWQYTAAMSVKGIGDNVNGNVFFGGEGEYKQFRLGAKNVALAAAQRD